MLPVEVVYVTMASVVRPPYFVIRRTQEKCAASDIAINLGLCEVVMMAVDADVRSA